MARLKPRAALSRWRALAFLLGGLTLLSLPLAQATPRYRVQAIRQFHYDQGNPLWQLDRRVMACTYCHVNDQGGAPWNPFGEALRAQFREDAAAGRNSSFAQVLHDLLKAGQDADGDGYADALEVYAHTLPGDAQSKPEQAPQDVQRAFAEAGGLEQYAAPTARP